MLGKHTTFGGKHVKRTTCLWNKLHFCGTKLGETHVIVEQNKTSLLGKNNTFGNTHHVWENITLKQKRNCLGCYIDDWVGHLKSYHLSQVSDLQILIVTLFLRCVYMCLGDCSTMFRLVCCYVFVLSQMFQITQTSCLTRCLKMYSL